MNLEKIKDLMIVYRNELIILLVVGTLAAIPVHNYKTEAEKTRIAADIAQGKLMKLAIDHYKVTSMKDLNKVIGAVVSAQLDGGKQIVVNDSNMGQPVFYIDFSSQTVQVKDITNGTVKVIWSSSEKASQ